MSYPNTLIYVDFPSPDPEATGRFYNTVFGWVVEGKPDGVYYRMVPGQEFLKDGQPSGVGNLHLGIYKTDEGRPRPGGYPDSTLASGRGVRVWILVSDDDEQDAILDRAEANGATILWRHRYWDTFNGFCGAFQDPWGSEVVLWTKGGDNPVIPEGYTSV